MKKPNNIKSKIAFPLISMLCFIMVPMLSFAQGPPDPGDTPIDGGLSFLVAVGVGYGIKKYRNHRGDTSL